MAAARRPRKGRPWPPKRTRSSCFLKGRLPWMTGVPTIPAIGTLPIGLRAQGAGTGHRALSRGQGALGRGHWAGGTGPSAPGETGAPGKEGPLDKFLGKSDTEPHDHPPPPVSQRSKPQHFLLQPRSVDAQAGTPLAVLGSPYPAQWAPAHRHPPDSRQPLGGTGGRSGHVSSLPPSTSPVERPPTSRESRRGRTLPCSGSVVWFGTSWVQCLLAVPVSAYGAATGQCLLAGDSGSVPTELGGAHPASDV